MFDVIIVGGSYAGAAAALQLARGRRKVLVIDAGVRRNRFAHSSHGFLTRDGTPPDEIAGIAKAQLLAYPNVTWIEGEAAEASGSNDDFTVAVRGGESHRGRRLVLATGIVDLLPDLPGLAEQWGRSAFHCPYCHGYELDRGQIGVLAVGAHSFHQAMMLPDWGETTYFAGGFAPTAEESAQLAARGARIEATPVASVAAAGDGIAVTLADGREARLAGLFLAPPTMPASPLAGQLGCETDETMGHRFIRTDATKATSVAGVFACGDTARMGSSLAFAVADGVMAGSAAHRSMIFAGH